MKHITRLLAAFSVSTSITFTESQPAYAIEPMTIAAAASLGAALLNASAKPSSVSLQVAMAQLDVSIAMHNRLDKIEDSLASILTSLANMPDEMRKVAEEDRNQNRSEEMMAIMDRLHSQLKVAEKENRNPARDPMILDNFNELQNTRARLFKRSDLVTPTVIQAFVVEVAVAKALRLSDAHMEEIYDQYDKRLNKALSGDKGSLQAIYDELSAQHRTHETNLFKTFTAGHTPASPSFVTGDYPWISHSLQQTVLKYRSTIGREYNPDINRWIVVNGREPYHENDPVHDSTRGRKVTVYPSPVDAGLYRLDIELLPRVTVANTAQSLYTPHVDSDDDHEKPHVDAHNTFMVDVGKFNTRTEILEQYKMMLDLTRMTSALIKQGPKAQSQALQDKIAAMNEGVLENSSLIDRLTGKANANLLIMRMEAERAVSRETIDRAHQRINRAIEQARKEQWKYDVMAGLNILSASMQFAEAIKTEAALSQMNAATDVVNSTAALSQNSEQQNKVVEGQTKEQAEQVSKDPAFNVGITERNPLEKLNSYAEKLLSMTSQPGPDGVDKALIKDAYNGLKMLEQFAPTIRGKYYAEKAADYLDMGETWGGALGESIGSRSMMPLQVTILTKALRSTPTATDAKMDYHAMESVRQKFERVIVREIVPHIPDRSLIDDLRTLHPDDLKCFEGPCLKAAP